MTGHDEQSWKLKPVSTFLSPMTEHDWSDSITAAALDQASCQELYLQDGFFAHYTTLDYKTTRPVILCCYYNFKY